MRLSAALFACLALAASPVLAGSVEKGLEKTKTRGCRTCHGKDGQGTTPVYPNLAGQKAAYMEQQLKAFRSGKRQAPQMSIVAKNLSDQDIADLAAYYASLEPCP
jgi:cytochrome c553